MVWNWFIRKSSVQNKFLIASLVLIIIPLGLFGAISLQISKNSIASQVSQSNLKTLGQIADKTDRMLDDIIAVSNQFYLSTDVNHAFTTTYNPDSYDYAMQRSSFDHMLSNSIYSFNRISFQVLLTGLNGFQFPADPSADPPPVRSFMEKEWYRAALNGQGRIIWVTNPMPELTGAKSHAAFYGVRISKRFESGSPTGIVSVSVDESSLNDLYSSALDKAQEIEIVDTDGLILSSAHKDQLDQSLAERPYYHKIRDYDSGYFIAKEGGEEQLISFQTIGKTNWKLISYTPTATVLASINQLQKIVIIVFAVVVLLAYAASYFMARRLAVPIKRLYNHFGRVELGDLSVRLPVTSEDEIGNLTRKFNRMLDRIEELLDNIRLEQERKRHAELQALQSQINPHFLYNTLASIRFMLFKHTPETIDSVIVALVKLLKQSISKQDELIPIGEELAMVRNYLYIQQIRQGDRMEIRYELEEAIYEYKTIKLILQPLIENAIFHGLERKAAGLRQLKVRGYIQGMDILFEISDNGIGMEQQEAVEQLAGTADKDSKLVHRGGYRNVHERLQLYFGGSYGIRLETCFGEGTTVYVRIPAIHKWEEVRVR
ncbi:two-component system, sensor histidine kinase YesM [Paenibacillus catalpae]|uniref:Two-component system, sensor histidine kinase YesM n=1 Tax=Paenibacillus catalpae TaxID=1045775 RepID=A0A1I2CUN0_9BACL|nr:sensor histidine kinase [Paenibacillus catalpae]SFE71968.1 two-component system, sensor histidine kinase YesM [Paenibacillus catalpae]